MSNELYDKIVCALAHNIVVCDECKKCGDNGADIRLDIIRELANATNKEIPWRE